MKTNSNQPATKNDLNELRKNLTTELKQFILEAIHMVVEGQKDIYDKLDDHGKQLTEIQHEQRQIKSTLQDVHRRVIGLEQDTSTSGEVEKLKQRITKLEPTHSST